MSRTKSLIIALSFMVLGYLVSYLYTSLVLGTVYQCVHSDLYYLFYIPLVYFGVYAITGNTTFGKYNDAAGYFLIALFLILYSHITMGKPVLSHIFFACLGLFILLVPLRFFAGELKVKYPLGKNKSMKTRVLKMIVLVVSITISLMIFTSWDTIKVWLGQVF
ncbi:hypothetical protein [Negadavirga shengliensis]|uniref:Uncharacterized protein n=1 Tax=Negadavirga shengliensis TaxID=1389218 RepID=A0ABV9SVB2_9BACT